MVSYNHQSGQYNWREIPVDTVYNESNETNINDIVIVFYSLKCE